MTLISGGGAMRRHRVVMLLENNPYPADVRVRAEAESLARAGYQVEVIAPRDEAELRRESVDGVEVRRFWLPRTPASTPGFIAEYAVANLQLYRLGFVRLLSGAGVLHFHNPPDTLFGIGFLARLLRREVVFDHHDLAPELFEAKFGPSPVSRLLRLFERLSFRSATLVLCANDSHRDLGLSRGGVPPSRAVVVRNGPPSATLGVAREARGEALEDPRLIFLGSMESQDGVDSLVDVLELLVSEHALAGATLTCVGDGSRRVALGELAIARGVGQRIRFTGKVPHAQVPDLLARADICIDPAPCSRLNHHSTMIKIAEYMAARRPVVAFPLMETRRTAGDSVAYASCGDPRSFAAAIASLAGDPRRRAELADRGHQRARALTWERSEVNLLEAYRRVANGRGRLPSDLRAGESAARAGRP